MKALTPFATPPPTPFLTQSQPSSTICQCVTTANCEIAGGISPDDGAGKIEYRIQQSYVIYDNFLTELF
jgi:hypothetical protein